MTDIIPTITINKSTQLIRVNYNDTFRLIDIIDTLSKEELFELIKYYGIEKGYYDDVIYQIKMRIRGIIAKPHKKVNNISEYIVLALIISFAINLMVLISRIF